MNVCIRKKLHTSLIILQRYAFFAMGSNLSEIINLTKQKICLRDLSK